VTDTSESGSTRNSNAQVSVLVGEDDMLVRKVIALQLVDLPIDIYEASNAADALAICARRTPALALVDMGLPDMSGAQLCAEIRRLYPGTPVCMISGATGAADLRQAAEAGCSEYLVKPFAAKELKELVTRFLAGPGAV
jgi:two-component system response regulator FlrC